MNRTIFLLFFLISSSFFSQQNKEFIQVKEYHDYQRYMIGKKLKTKFEKEENVFEKSKIQKSFYDIMEKVDSIENNNYVRALIITKNKEDLGSAFPELKKEKNEEVKFLPPPPPMLKTNNNNNNNNTVQKDAEYPGGINLLRKEVANYFYIKAIKKDLKEASTKVYFIVEKDGTITHVKAKGEDPGFNTQAEIAIYRLSKKFTPAYVNGKPVRYRFTIPLTMHFD